MALLESPYYHCKTGFYTVKYLEVFDTSKPELARPSEIIASAGIAF